MKLGMCRILSVMLTYLLAALEFAGQKTKVITSISVKNFTQVSAVIPFVPALNSSLSTRTWRLISLWLTG